MLSSLVDEDFEGMLLVHQRSPNPVLGRSDILFYSDFGPFVTTRRLSAVMLVDLSLYPVFAHVE